MRAIVASLAGILFLIPASNCRADVPKGKGQLSPHRRMLGICVSEYLYLPTVSYEADTAGNLRLDFGAMLSRLGLTLKVPAPQIYELSDSALGKKRIAPTRGAIEHMIGQFLDGSRTSDQVVLLFVGHQIELDGEVYLVPLDGDAKNPATLFSLNSLLKRLEACPARPEDFDYRCQSSRSPWRNGGWTADVRER